MLLILLFEVYLYKKNRKRKTHHHHHSFADIIINNNYLFAIITYKIYCFYPLEYRKGFRVTFFKKKENDSNSDEEDDGDDDDNFIDIKCLCESIRKWGNRSVKLGQALGYFSFLSYASLSRWLAMIFLVRIFFFYSVVVWFRFLSCYVVYNLTSLLVLLTIVH